MRGRVERRPWGALALFVLGTAACGDDGATGAGGSGGSSSSAATSTTTTTTTVAATTAASTTAGVSSGGEGGATTASTGEGGGEGGEGGAGGGTGGTGGSGGEGAGPPVCTPITIDEDGEITGAAFTAGRLFAPALGDEDTQDAFGLSYPIQEGDFSLSDVFNDNLATCRQCVLVLEDTDGTIPGSGRVFFQSEGLMAVIETDEGTRAVVSGLTLVEVTVGDEFVSTPVEGGACLTVSVAVVEVDTPPVWTCGLEHYGTGDGCDCNCTIPDPDCSDPNAPIFGCGPQHQASSQTSTCSAEGECVAPADWSCDEALFLDGEACNCECGAPDADCGGTPLPIEGCEADEACVDGTCFGPPDGWTCGAATYQDGFVCDCECGIHDPDCDFGGTEVANCQPGEVCSLEDTCTTPPGWECDDALFGDGETCDCVCGANDPDCEGDLPVVGCEPEESCIADTCAIRGENDLCVDAIPLEVGTTVGTWLGSSNELSPAAPSCTNFPETGADVFYSVSLDAGQTLTVSIAAGAPADASLYLVTDCADATTCVAGADAGGGLESLTYTAEDDVDLFLVVDQFGSTEFVGFTLTVAIE